MLSFYKEKEEISSLHYQSFSWSFVADEQAAWEKQNKRYVKSWRSLAVEQQFSYQWRRVCKSIVQRHRDMPWTFAEAPGMWQINIWNRKGMESKFQVKTQNAEPRYICIFYHSNLYQWWRLNQPVMWSSCGRNQWHNSHWRPPGIGLHFEIKSCPDEQLWEKKNIVCCNLATQIASVCTLQSCVSPWKWPT